MEAVPPVEGHQLSPGQRRTLAVQRHWEVQEQHQQQMTQLPLRSTCGAWRWQVEEPSAATKA